MDVIKKNYQTYNTNFLRGMKNVVIGRVWNGLSTSRFPKSIRGRGEENHKWEQMVR